MSCAGCRTWSCTPALPRGAIERLEARYGIRLPTVHRELLLRSNGIEAAGGYLRLYGVGPEATIDMDAWNEPDVWKFAWHPIVNDQQKAAGALGTPRGIKVGGDPYFFRDWPDAFPRDRWRLLLQLDGDLPFSLNLGVDGIGYVLVRNRPPCRRLLLGRPG